MRGPTVYTQAMGATPFSRGRGEAVDPARCRAAVWLELDRRFSQCSRGGTVMEGGLLWCRQHAPSLAAKREEAKLEACRERRRRNRLADEMAAARRKIADIAIRYFRQEATFEELEAAVQAYEELEAG